MADISSSTTTNRALLEAQQSTLDSQSDDLSEIIRLLTDLIAAIKEITDR